MTIHDSYKETVPMPNNLFPMKIGANSYFPKYSKCFQLHFHPYIELIYIHEGAGWFECGTNSFYAKKNDFIIVNLNELHQGFTANETIKYDCIIMDLGLLESSPNDLCYTKYILPLIKKQILLKNLIHASESISHAIKSIIDNYTYKPQGYELLIKSCYYQLFYFLITEYSYPCDNPGNKLNTEKNMERLLPTFEYINENYYSNLSVSHLADMVNLSRYHFTRIFKELTRQSPTEYINFVRIQKAQNLLIHSTKNITEIAFDTGFHDANYFSRTFKKYTKISPTQFIQNHQYSK